MSKNKKLAELRNHIEDARLEVMKGRGDGRAPNVDVLDLIKSRKGSEIKELEEALIDIALTKLYNDVSNRKGPISSGNEGPDLFGGYSGVPKAISISTGEKKDTSKLTFSEADSWLKDHEEEKRQDKHAGFRKMIEECRRFQVSDDDTLEAAMRRKLESEGKLEF